MSKEKATCMAASQAAVKIAQDERHQKAVKEGVPEHKAMTTEEYMAIYDEAFVDEARKLGLDSDARDYLAMRRDKFEPAYEPRNYQEELMHTDARDF